MYQTQVIQYIPKVLYAERKYASTG